MVRGVLGGRELLTTSIGEGAGANTPLENGIGNLNKKKRGEKKRDFEKKNAQKKGLKSQFGREGGRGSHYRLFRKQIEKTPKRKRETQKTNSETS